MPDCSNISHIFILLLVHSAHTARLRSSYFREMVELRSSVDGVDHDMTDII